MAYSELFLQRHSSSITSDLKLHYLLIGYLIWPGSFSIQYSEYIPWAHKNPLPWPDVGHAGVPTNPTVRDVKFTTDFLG